jgi:organic hydroperoxide reductase OsmC/OhrA
MDRMHHYALTVEWTGARNVGTVDYRSYRRDHVVRVAGKPDLAGSSDPTFRGDRSRHNPEDLLVAALSACHLMSYLHVCAIHGVVVTAYVDEASGRMETFADGSGRFREVVLNPQVTVRDADMVALATELHHKAHELCFIANSVNFPVRCLPVTHAAHP